jgi:glycine C-acetyltransferase
MDFNQTLFDAGLMATIALYQGKARIRTIMTSEHTREQIDQSLDI